MDFLPSLQNKKPLSIYATITFAVLFVLVCLFRLRVLIGFSFIYTDSDQAVLWDALDDMKHGIFHEPCFYGQAYSLLVEPLLALPLAWVGIPANIALPVITVFLATLPFFLLGWGCFRQGYYISACFALTVPLWLPVGYSAMTSIPRGFVGSTAFAAMGVYAAVFSRGKLKHFWFALFSVLAIATNIDGVFLIFPVALVYWLQNIKKWSYYKHIVLGVLAAAIVPIFKYEFYKIHPEHNLHILEFFFNSWLLRPANLEPGKIFLMLTPYSHHKLATYFGLILSFAFICFLKRNWRFGLSMILTIILIYVSTGNYKAHDGYNTLFFSCSRMFVALPVVLVLFFFWAEVSLRNYKWYSKFLVYSVTILLCIGIICFSERNNVFKDFISNDVKGLTKVEVHSVTDVYAQCRSLDSLSAKYHFGLIVTFERCVNYICPIIYPSLRTIEPDYERRVWVMREEDTTHRDHFLFYSCDSAFVKQAIDSGYSVKVIDPSPMSCLIENKGQNTFDILKKIGITVRLH